MTFFHLLLVHFLLLLIREFVSLRILLIVLFLEGCDGHGTLGRHHIDLVWWAQMLMMQELGMLRMTWDRTWTEPS